MRPEAVPDWRVESHDILASTQQLLKDRLAQGLNVDGVVVRAAEQPAGRGRQGKGWSSPLGGSYQSFALRDRWGGALRSPVLPLAFALGLVEEFRAAGAQAQAKWPNDVYLGDGKLAGVLSEYVRGHLIVGVGVNVVNPLPPGAAGLQGWTVPFVSNLVVEVARRTVVEVVMGGEEVGVGLPARFATCDLLAGRAVVVRTPAGEISGVACGVDVAGALLVSSAGELRAAGDGTVVSWGCEVSRYPA